MFGMPKSFTTALGLIFKDPINLLLAIIPTIMALTVYLFTIVFIYRNSDRFASMFRGYIYTADQATVLAKVLTGVLIIFIFFLMSWTFVIVVGIIAAPFNSMLSSRIEDRLCGNKITDDKSRTLNEIAAGLGKTFKNELKKLIFVVMMAGVAFVLNLFPLFYPVGLMILSLLLSIQFVDYSWSRNDVHFGKCLADTMKNIIPYTMSGFAFLMLVSIPLVNTLVPALATSYYTVLWLQRQNKISL
jgi:CysZ protein